MNKDMAQILASKNNIFTENLNENEITFLKNLKQRQLGINETLNDIETKRNTMLKTMEDNSRTIDKNPKDTREYINSYETALESAEVIYKNLTRLQNTYIDIEKLFFVITEKWQFNYEISKLKNDLIILAEKINLAEFYEENFEKDNEKNYLIINAFMKQPKEVKISSYF